MPVTQLSLTATPGRRQSFSPKAEAIVFINVLGFTVREERGVFVAEERGVFVSERKS